jgi:maleate isomerase
MSMATLGTLTPSSNIVVERVTNGIVADLKGVSAHFTRVPVVGDKVHLLDRHDIDTMLAAARLLADARMDVICWNGSKAGGIAFAADRELCSRIATETGAKATTSILAIDEVFRQSQVKRFALVTPFPGEYQHKVIRVFAREGYDCAAEEHLDIYDNYENSQVSGERIAAMVRRAATAKPDAILILCTNLAGAPVVAPLEQEIGLPVYDSVSIGAWHSLKLAGVDTRPAAARWGSLFAGT